MSERPRHLVFYDDACPLCRRQAARWRRLDWARQFEFRPLQTPGPEALAVGLDPAQLRQAIHCLDRRGRVHQGAACLRFLWLRLPALAVAGLLLSLPGVLPLAEAVYRRVAASRHRVGGASETRSGTSSMPASHCVRGSCVAEAPRDNGP